MNLAEGMSMFRSILSNLVQGMWNIHVSHNGVLDLDLCEFYCWTEFSSPCIFSC